MTKKMRKELDAPEAQSVGAVSILTFSVFFSVVWLFTMMGTGLETKMELFTWIELVFHLLFMGLSVGFMKEYLADSWNTVFVRTGETVRKCIWAVVALLAYAYIVPSLPRYFENVRELTMWEVCLPLLTNNLHLTSHLFVNLNPIVGIFCAVFVAPVATSCIFYATAFAKGYNVRPWLGYLLIVPATLIPALLMWFTAWWNLKEELFVFLFRLPMHLICCKLYQSADTIWAPILAQMAFNLLACILILAHVL